MKNKVKKQNPETNILDEQKDVNELKQNLETNILDEQEDINEHIELNVSPTNKFFRKNQCDTIAKMKEQKYSSGIHSQIMGAGKSYIILNTINKIKYI